MSVVTPIIPVLCRFTVHLLDILVTGFSVTDGKPAAMAGHTGRHCFATV